MRKIILACVAGMSTSMLVKKMREAAEKDGYACEIAAYPIDELKGVEKDADIILLGPQVSFQVDKIAKEAPCPVEAIKMRDYGTMSGEAVLKAAKKVLGD